MSFLRIYYESFINEILYLLSPIIITRLQISFNIFVLYFVRWVVFMMKSIYKLYNCKLKSTEWNFR